jgi:2'-5' RNA ligase
VQPLTITVAIEEEAQQRLDAERARWSGAAEPAHLTLFESVPSDLEEQVRVDLVHVAGPAFPIGVAGVLPTSTGVAYALISPELLVRRKQLQNLWWEHLDGRDRRPYRPHVTVVTGADPATARAALTVLRRAFQRYQARADGFVLWRATEPWTELARIPFPS